MVTLTPPPALAELAVEKHACWMRGCKHIQIEWLEPLYEQHGETLTCPAFPKGNIPHAIANGTNLHLVRHRRQHGDVVFAPGRFERRPDETSDAKGPR